VVNLCILKRKKRGIRQREALMRSMHNASISKVPLMACILGWEDMMREQVSIADELGCDKFVLGLNHLGENRGRFDMLMRALGTWDKVWLYNMPTFEPASLEFIKECMEDGRVQGIKDSSRWSNPEWIHKLLTLKQIRPDFQVFVGNESVYAELTAEDLVWVDGLVSGNSNVDPELLYNFTQNPWEYASARQSLHWPILESIKSNHRDRPLLRESFHSSSISCFTRWSSKHRLLNMPLVW